MRVLIFMVGLATLPTFCFSQDNGDSESKVKVSVAAAIAGTPKIDGKPEELWAKAPKIKVDKPIEDLLEIEQEAMATATVQFLWDQDHLYALCNVKDAKLAAAAGVDPWEQDSVELFVDQNMKRSVYYQSDDAQYRVNFQGDVSGQGSGYKRMFLKSAVSKTKTGYIVEMSLKLDKVELKAGTKLGLELQINDDVGEGKRSAVAKWNYDGDDSWEDTSNFGTLEMK